ncbi:Formylmethionine deformylase [Artemisia annua]|uniref:Peptide deformylase n=1 Tax=Artemisia annua TaxID=35608 RepID=A0A2U1P6S9_ARTAN|nr:Formylmethionine deformylase [Artemisia annua]
MKFAVLILVFLTLITTQTQSGQFVKDISKLCYPKWAPEAFVIANANSIFIIPIAFVSIVFLVAYEIDQANLPRIVNVGDPILHQPACEVYLNKLDRSMFQKTIDDMVKVMRKEGVASLSAPQIGVPIKDTKLYMAPSSDEVNEKQDRHPSNLLEKPRVFNTSLQGSFVIAL